MTRATAQVIADLVEMRKAETFAFSRSLDYWPCRDAQDNAKRRVFRRLRDTCWVEDAGQDADGWPLSRLTVEAKRIAAEVLR